MNAFNIHVRLTFQYKTNTFLIQLIFFSSSADANYNFVLRNLFHSALAFPHSFLAVNFSTECIPWIFCRKKKKWVVYDSEVFMHVRIPITDRIKNSLESGRTVLLHPNYIIVITIYILPPSDIFRMYENLLFGFSMYKWDHLKTSIIMVGFFGLASSQNLIYRIDDQHAYILYIYHACMHA